MRRMTSEAQRALSSISPAMRLAIGALLALPALAHAQGATPQTHSVRPGDTLARDRHQLLMRGIFHTSR